jgi:hypothetical protein
MLSLQPLSALNDLIELAPFDVGIDLTPNLSLKTTSA